MKTEFFRIGVITSPHGVKGEVNVFPTGDDPSRFKKLKKVYLDEGRTPMTITGVKFFKNMVILGFKEIPDRNAAEKYREREIYVDREHAAPLEEGEYYISDVLGSTVVTDEGVTLGKLTDVMRTGANDVFEVTLENGKTVLLPKIDQCVLKIDVDEGMILVHMMPGLM